MTSFVPLKVFQDQKLHEDSESYQNLEEYLRRILPINSRLEDSVKSRRITNISEPQESENPRTRIPWVASNVPAKDGRKRAREESGSAKYPLARPSGSHLMSVSVSFSFSPTSSSDYI